MSNVSNWLVGVRLLTRPIGLINVFHGGSRQDVIPDIDADVSKLSGCSFIMTTCVFRQIVAGVVAGLIYGYVATPRTWGVDDINIGNTTRE